MHETLPAPSHAKPGLLGVCRAISEDFGFNPEWLRAALVIAMLFAAGSVIVAYLAMGLVVALSRWLVPNRRRATLRLLRPASPPTARRMEYAEAA